MLLPLVPLTTLPSIPFLDTEEEMVAEDVSSVSVSFLLATEDFSE